MRWERGGGDQRSFVYVQHRTGEGGGVRCSSGCGVELPAKTVDIVRVFTLNSSTTWLLFASLVRTAHQVNFRSSSRAKRPIYVAQTVGCK